jgi:peptide/nickel transport system substrate-binding protein
MDLRRIWHPRTLLALGALAVTGVLVACGGATTTTPTTTGDTSGGASAPAAQAATPTLNPFAGEQEPTPTAPLDVAPTAVPVPTAMVAVDQRPDWWQEGEAQHYRGDFPLVATSNPGFWDVHYGGSMNTVLIPSGPRFNQILEYNPVNPGEIIGDLAVSWESYEDGDEFGYIFNLHPEATFSDGVPVTAEDVVFSIDRITLGQVEEGVLRARTGFLNNFVVHGTAEAIDDKTVKIPLRFPAAGFLPNLASDYMKVYPKHVGENLTQEQANQGKTQAEAVSAINAGTPNSLIGSGPWMLREWEKDVGYSYDRNPNYFKEGRPFFDGLRIFLIRDTARRLSALQAGQVFGTYQPVTGSNRPEDMARLEEDTGGRVRAVILRASGIQAFFLNHDKAPFDDARVRRAFYLGLDRDLGVEKSILGFGEPGTFFAPGVVEDLEDLRANNSAYGDRAAALTEARQLLTEAGYPDGFEITVNVVNSNPSLSSAEVVAPQMREDLNINIVIEPTDLATMYVGMRDGVANMDAVGTGIILRDPGDIINQFYLQDVLRNPHNWQNDRVDELINLQNREVDPAARQAHLEELAGILHQGESHWLPYFWYSSGGAFDCRIRNYHYPPTVQLIKKWDHVWWAGGESSACDHAANADRGYQP